MEEPQIQFGIIIGEVNLCNIPIKIYSNVGYVESPYPEVNQVMNNKMGLKWQCVEFVRRFYFYKYAIDLRSKWRAGDAHDWANAYQEMGLVKLPVDEALPGDIACFTGGLYGHVCVVGINMENNIHLVSQNAFNDIRDLGYNIPHDNPILDTGAFIFKLDCILRDAKRHEQIIDRGCGNS